MVWAWSLRGVVVPAVVGLAARAGLVAGVLAGAEPVAGAGLPVVAAWYWSIHWWRAG